MTQTSLLDLLPPAAQEYCDGCKIAYVWPGRAGFSRFSVLDPDNAEAVENQRGIRDDFLDLALQEAGLDVASAEVRNVSPVEWETTVVKLKFRMGKQCRGINQ